jgi:hypothetical protein
MNYKINTTVKSVERLKRVVRGRMVGGQAILEEEDLGWFVCFEGSWERLHMGAVQPNLVVGQKVEIIIRGL